ncbi:MAG: cytochrome c family protein, partial [Deltaproteobacteria bacterium]|nr:cytochrome c family protein [Deltaproteobacteria bacterium]
MKTNTSNRCLVLAVLAALVAGMAGCEKRPQSVTGEAMPPVVVRVAENSGYAGAAACKECHEEIFNGWRATFHAYKFQPVNPGFIIGDFSRNNTLTEQKNSAEMTREGDRFFVTVNDAAGKKKRHPVDYVLGSVWKQRYVTRGEGGGLYVLPVQWNVLNRSWVGYHDLEQENAQSGPWDAPANAFQFRCMGCHTTNASVTGGVNGQPFETTWSDLGVACEACHGPGAAHVRAPVREKASTIL